MCMSTLPNLALSIRQPWAWAIAFGLKDIENRTTFAVNKGDMKPKDICVHAAKGMTQDEYDSTRRFMAELGIECPRPDDLVRGAIIGTCTVVDVVKKHDSPWFFGPRGLVLTNQKTISPIASSGALGYFKWSADGEIDMPKPWMIAWPEIAKSSKRKSAPIVEAMPLFETQG